MIFCVAVVPAGIVGSHPFGWVSRSGTLASGLSLGQRLAGLQQGLQAGDDDRPAAADALQHGAAGVEAVVGDGQFDQLPSGLNVEGRFRPPLGSQPGQELLIPAEPLRELGHESMPGVGQPPGRAGLEHDLPGVGDQHAVVVPGHRRPLLPVRVEGDLPVAAGERRVGQRLPQPLRRGGDIGDMTN